MTPVQLHTTDADLLNAAMSSSRSARVQHHPFHLSRSEQTSAQYAQKEQNEQWSCKLCHAVFGNTLRLVTHILTSCDQPLSTFSNRSAMHICMVLDESGSREMFETYLRIASEDADDEGSGHGSDMDTEVTDDTDSGEYDSQATISEEDNEPVKRKQAGADADGVWRVEQGEGDKEEEVGYVGYEGEDGADTMDDQPTLAAQGKRVRPPKNQEFPVIPPHSLSADKKREWTFRRNRKYQHTPPNYPQ